MPGKLGHEFARHLCVMVLTLSTIASGQAPAVRLYAAGSLRVAMTEVAQAFSTTGEPVVNVTFGASGLLRERIEKGEPADVFASADMGNPQALARAAVRAHLCFSRAIDSVRLSRLPLGWRQTRCSPACSIRRSSSAR